MRETARRMESLLLEIITTHQTIHDKAIEASARDEREAEERRLQAYGKALELGHDPYGILEGDTVKPSEADVERALEGIDQARVGVQRAEERAEAAWALAYQCSQIIGTAKSTLAQLKAA